MVVIGNFIGAMVLLVTGKQLLNQWKFLLMDLSGVQLLSITYTPLFLYVLLNIGNLPVFCRLLIICSLHLITKKLSWNVTQKETKKKLTIC